MQFDLFSTPPNCGLANEAALPTQTHLIHALGDQRIVEHRDFVRAADAPSVYDRIDVETAWRADTIRIAGRVIPVPRLQYWVGEPHCHYAYSGIALRPSPWTALLSSLRSQVEEMAGTRYNCVLLNKYRDGSDSVSWHADDEPQLGSSPSIASLSLGAVRRFHLKPKPEPKTAASKSINATTSELGPERRYTLDLLSGSLLVMQPGVQEHWLHQVPKTARATGPRINLTFRYIPLTSEAGKLV